MTAFSSAHRARGIASDALCRSHPHGSAYAKPRTRRQVPIRRHFVKNDDIVKPGRLPSTSAASFASACAGLLPPNRACAWFSGRARNHWQPATGTTMSPPWNRLPSSIHRPGMSWTARPERILRELAARCESSAWTGRRSSTSATRTIREHNHAITRSPTHTFDTTHPACAELGGNLQKGVSPSATSTAAFR